MLFGFTNGASVSLLICGLILCSDDVCFRWVRSRPSLLVGGVNLNLARVSHLHAMDRKTHASKIMHAGKNKSNQNHIPAVLGPGVRVCLSRTDTLSFRVYAGDWIVRCMKGYIVPMGSTCRTWIKVLGKIHTAKGGFGGISGFSSQQNQIKKGKEKEKKPNKQNRKTNKIQNQK